MPRVPTSTSSSSATTDAAPRIAFQTLLGLSAHHEPATYRQIMNNTTAVDVFLGHPLVDATEKHFLARLRRGLALHGVPARILANLQVGDDFRQLDFVIVTDQRAVVCELKSAPTRGARR